MVQTPYRDGDRADGNLLTYNGWTFTWNGENRLATATNGTVTLSFSYDYMGRRIAKAIAGGATFAYTYDGWNLLRERKTVGGTSATKDFIWGLDLSQTLQGAGGVGGLLSVILPGETPLETFAVYDANGNVTEYVNASGTTVAHYEYDPFGGISRQTGALADEFPHRFSTKYLDSETGLVYYGYRYYSPALGRWLSRDPIGEHGGINLYGMIQNSPVCNYDPVGLSLGSDITRIFASRVLTPIINVFRSNHYDLFDDDNEMASDISAQLSAFYQKFLCSKLSEARASWRPLLIPEMNAPQYMGKAFYVTEGLKGWWLSGSYNVHLRGGLEFRCAANNCLEYRKLDVLGEWHDDIDANSFPGISGWAGDTKDVFDNEAPWLAAVIEGIWDIIGDGIADTDFEVTVTFTDKREGVRRVCCGN